MKINLTSSRWAIALGAIAMTSLLTPALQARPRATDRTVAIGERGGRDNHLGDDRRGRGRGKDDAANHNAADDRRAARTRAGNDDPANHEGTGHK